MLNLLSYFIATGLYSGKSPKAPGTVGTVTYLLLWITALNFLDISQTTSIVVAGLLAALGTASTHHILANGAEYFSEEDRKDPKSVVIDEWCGQSIALIGLTANDLELIIVAFILFRFFDITKLGPVGRAEKLPGAYGIMADDIVAGILSALIIFGIKTIL